MESQVKISAERRSAGEYGPFLISRYHDLSSVLAKPLVVYFHHFVLVENKKAQAAFEKFSPSHKNEYIEWIDDAKTESTRIKRLETAIEWMAEGKSRHWKYQR